MAKTRGIGSAACPARPSRHTAYPFLLGGEHFLVVEGL
jgi:hypothetical protein